MPFTFAPVGPVTAYQFPDDASAGESAFLSVVSTGSELWLRAYALTLKPLAAALIARQKAGQLTHITVDHSCMVDDKAQKALVDSLVAAGLEITVCTSYAGKEYIAHEKTAVDADGLVFTGSTNWSESAWRQINKSLAFRSPEFVQQFVASFNTSVAYAWKNEREYQLMSEPPANITQADLTDPVAEPEPTPTKGRAASKAEAVLTDNESTTEE